MLPKLPSNALNSMAKTIRVLRVSRKRSAWCESVKTKTSFSTSTPLNWKLQKIPLSGSEFSLPPSPLSFPDVVLSLICFFLVCRSWWNSVEEEPSVICMRFSSIRSVKTRLLISAAKHCRSLYLPHQSIIPISGNWQWSETKRFRGWCIYIAIRKSIGTSKEGTFWWPTMETSNLVDNLKQIREPFSFKEG